MSKIQAAILMFIMAASGVMGAAFAGWMFCPETAKAQDGGTLKANTFQVADNNGYARMVLTTMPESGDPVIIFYDAQGAERMMLSTSNNLPLFSFWDSKGKVRIAGAVMEDGASSLELVDNADKVIWSKP